MRRSVLLTVGLFAGAAAFAACRDAAVAPVDRAVPVVLEAPTVNLNELAASRTGISFWITIDPRRDNLYSDGINSIRIPAGAICDPATSSYGPAYWDAPCTAASAPITMPVRVSLLNQRLVLYFGKDLRFVPTSDPAKQVQLVVSAPKVKTTSEPLSAYDILWIPSSGDTFVDEAKSDPSLATVVLQDQGRIVRRLKHFSGYYVHLGFTSECDPNVDIGCMPR